MSAPEFIALAVACISLAAWIYLLVGRGQFWRCLERDDRDLPARDPDEWPAVTAVVPARSEADVIARSLGGLLHQDYPGTLSVVLVDDDSQDDTLALAREIASRADGRLEVVQGTPKIVLLQRRNALLAVPGRGLLWARFRRWLAPQRHEPQQGDSTQKK